MQNTEILVGRLKKALKESKETSLAQLMAGVGSMEDYRMVLGTIQAVVAFEDRIDYELKEMRKQLTGDDDDE